MRLWDATGVSGATRLRGHEGLVLCAAFSPDGRLVAVGVTDGTVRVWDAAATELACLRGHEGWVNSIAFSPDGTRIASGSGDRTVRLWEAASGRQLACLQKNERPLKRVAFGPGGTRLLCEAYDGTWRAWEVAGGTRPEAAPAGDTATAVAGPAHSPWQAVVRDLGTVIETAAGQAIARFPDRLDGIAPHPSGRTWAGVSGSYPCLFTLEGTAPAGPWAPGR